MKGAVCRREWRKLGCLGESRMDVGGTGGLSGLLLSLRAVYVYDILLVSLERGLSQLVPMCCCFWGFLSI